MKRLLVGAVVGLALLSGCSPAQSTAPTLLPSPVASPTLTVSPTPTPTVSPTPTSQPVAAPAGTASAVPPAATEAARAQAPVPAPPAPVECGADYYRNVDGVCVHRPVAGGGAPAGATAKCNDGTYSFSQHRQGTCSHHGGVAVWY